MDQSLVAIILAAGKGTRMASDLPKVVHEVADAPMVEWVARACRDAGCGRIIIVVGHRQELVRAIFDGDDDVEFVVQDEQLGTGHAVQCAEDTLKGFDGDVIVLAGDGPLVRAEALRGLVEHHRRVDGSATLATAIVDDPAGYGRILRNDAGVFTGIVEEKEATDAQRSVQEINPSVYCFKADELFQALSAVNRSETSGEYYLTDVPALLAQGGRRIDAVNSLQPDEALSINTPAQLAEVDRILRARLAPTGGA